MKKLIKTKEKCCEYCNNTELKTKKCQECGERTICSGCHYEKQIILCICCDEKLMRQYDEIEKEMNKEVNFNFQDLDEYIDEESYCYEEEEMYVLL